MAMILVIALLVVGVAGSGDDACTRCITAVRLAQHQDKPLSSVCSSNPQLGCADALKTGRKAAYFTSYRDLDGRHHTPLSVCRTAGLCALEPLPKAAAPVSPVDVRVSKGLGSFDYSRVRVSVISKTGSSMPSKSMFPYSEPFQYRWKDLHLSSGTFDITPGSKASFVIGNATVEVSLPSKGAGIRALVIADPCFSSKWIPCSYGGKLKTLEVNI